MTPKVGELRSRSGHSMLIDEVRRDLKTLFPFGVLTKYYYSYLNFSIVLM